ncbi:MAG: hypothetical protein M3O46_07860, partial [Myxococcota bacterium]|nr:hypothetical protein [Myxococcota bacterium]
AADCLDVDYVNMCTVLWNGTQPLGGSCSATQACQTSKAAPANCGTAGVCVAKATGSQTMGVAMGARCSGTCSASGSKCVTNFGASGGTCRVSDGLACIAGTCQTLRKQGDACSGEFDCADPLTCLSNACAPRLGPGSPCSLSSGYNTCDVGYGCVASVCTSLKPNGQQCTLSDECLENRCVAGQCVREFALPICGG